MITLDKTCSLLVKYKHPKFWNSDIPIKFKFLLALVPFAIFELVASFFEQVS